MNLKSVPPSLVFFRPRRAEEHKIPFGHNLEVHGLYFEKLSEKTALPFPVCGGERQVSESLFKCTRLPCNHPKKHLPASKRIHHISFYHVFTLYPISFPCFGYGFFPHAPPDTRRFCLQITKYSLLYRIFFLL